MASDPFSLTVTQRAHRWLMLLTVLLAVVSQPVLADTNVLVDDETDLPFSYSFDHAILDKGYELHLKGRNNSDSVLILIIRIDNEQSDDYYSRFNREFSIQPGPFSLVIPMTGLKTSGNKPMMQPYTEMIIFNAGSSDAVSLYDARITPPPPPPKQVLALDFGKEDSPVFPGFEPVTSEDPRLTGKLLQRFRPSGDPLIRDGIEGIDTLSVPWDNGEWQLTLWLQEQGEWEYLPHFLQREVLAEGKTLLKEQFTPTQWVADRYLAGARQEAVIHGDPWQLIGHRRSKPVSYKVVINDGVLNVQWKGNRSARYAAALVLEPLDGTFARDTENNRRARFLEDWPVSKPSFPVRPILSMTDESVQPATSLEHYKVYPVAANSRLNLNFTIRSPEEDLKPLLVTAPPRNSQGKKLELTVRYGHWRYERPKPNASTLVLSDSYLRGDLSSMMLSHSLPRNLYLQVAIPPGTEPGIYKGSLQLLSKGSLQVVGFAVDVLPIELPRLKKSVGLYLEPAPYFDWFAKLRQQKSLATACDLSLLSSLGFTNVAPALETPTDSSHQRKLIDQLHQLSQFGFNGPTLSYAPLKRLLLIQSRDKALSSLSALKDNLPANWKDTIYWSIYDEPKPGSFSDIRAIANQLHSQFLGMKTAGHLNNPKQNGLVGVTDLAIMNHGYGVSRTTIKNLQQDRSVWLYNMPDPRLAAGFYLWSSGAEGYLQWHGRMPTADPFDPTDGREGDVVYLYPWQSDCPATMNIHKRLLDLHEATIDLRWLQWLEAQARTDDQAGLLLEKLQRVIPEEWENAEENLSEKQLVKLRKSILEYAQESILQKETSVEE